jgi:hypothetical protein
VSESQPQPILSFEHSPSIAALAAALAKAQLVTKSAPKDHTAEVTMKSGGKYTYAYADLAGVWEAGREPLGANGLSLIQSPSLSASGCLEMTTMLLHGSGEWVIGRLTNFPVPDKTPQGVGTAITYARRYTMGAMVGVVSEEDDDGGNAGKPKAKRESREMPATGGAAPEPSGGAPTHFPKFGKGNGAAIRDAAPAVLEFHIDAARKSLADPSKAKWHAKESALIGALEAELARQRGATKAIVNGPPDPAGPPPPKAPSPAYHDAVAAGKANGWLEDNVKHWLKVKRGKSAASEVTADDAAELRKALEPPPKEEDPPF